MAIDLDRVRDLAEEHGYDESEHVENGRVISFHKDYTKINVYYTTGTVATCLSHPQQGKTQLFRRGVSLDRLHNIFQDPRVHSGTGFQLMKHLGMWKRTEKSESVETDRGDEEEEKNDEIDLARRWRFVCAVTNLCNAAETEKVVRFCNVWNTLEFEHGSDCMSIMRRRDGAACTLSGILVNVARKYHGAESVIFEHDGTESKYAVDDFSCYCDAGLDFQDSHRNEVKEAQEILLSLKRDVCREILIWFFGRTNAGNLLWSNEEVWWSNVAVNEAHNEYSDLYYPKSFSVCACHGIY